MFTFSLQITYITKKARNKIQQSQGRFLNPILKKGKGRKGGVLITPPPKKTKLNSKKALDLPIFFTEQNLVFCVY